MRSAPDGSLHGPPDSFVAGPGPAPHGSLHGPPDSFVAGPGPARLTALLLLGLATAIGCGGDDAPPGPYDDLPVDERVTGSGLTSPVDVIRDEYGVPHVLARTVGDLAFAQGYVMASDRIQQMDLFRHFASGRISELFGALAPDQIDGDLEMRIHRFAALAAETYAALAASSAPADAELVLFLERFADGVNHFLDDVRAGKRALDPAIATIFDPARTEPWTPADSLVIGRLQAMSLSYSDAELGETDVREAAIAGFDDSTDADRLRRAGAFADLVRITPSDPTTSRDGWPATGAAAPRATGPRAAVTRALLARVRQERAAWMARLGDPRNGSNNWVVGPPLTGDGRTLLANDPHLTLASPSIFYAVHLTIPGELDVAGITFPGIPGVILGHNQHIAWGATTVNHDVTDFYLEDVVPCGSGDCVRFDGDDVPIETWDETFQIGALGTITETRTVTFERVPHHGPILPTIVDHELVARPPGPAISVRYTGHEVTHELAAFQGLWRATTVEEASAAMQAFGFGAQNWVFTDDQGHIGWSSHANVPWRSAGCFTYDPATGDGVAPWMVVPGDGSCEWEGYMEAAYLPQEVDPARGYIATANADPVGSTLDGDPLDEPSVGGHLLYVGARDYDEGFRVGRITRRLEALRDRDAAPSVEDMMSVQADTYSNMGSAMTPAILAAIAALDAEVATPGAHPELASLAGDASARTRIAAASTLLAAWSFETPAGLGAADGSAEADDSAATVVFNAWLVEFTARALGDEAAVVGRGPGNWLTNAVVALLVAPESLRTGLAVETGEALLCDDLGTAGVVESCTLMILRALGAAMQWGSSTGGPGGAPATWRWGDLHRLTLEPLIPSDDLRIPGDSEADPSLDGGYPRHGDNHSVDASSPGFGDLDFGYDHGPAMRHVTELGGDGPRTLLAIPGGEVMRPTSPHWRDLMDQYWSINAYFELPWTTAQILEHHEERWRFE